MTQSPESVPPPADAAAPEVPTERPTAAGFYGIPLGSTHNSEADRQAAAAAMAAYPESVDIARENRLFLYRAVRYLAQEAGITQFLDLGSGLPSDQNVHQVAQEFQPDARVVYVDNDPFVIQHGRELLADDDSTTVILGDVTDTQGIIDHPDTQRLLDFTQPVGVLTFSIGHLIPDDDTARRTTVDPLRHVPSGSYLALSHVVTFDDASRTASTEQGSKVAFDWRLRAPADIDAWVTDLDAVEPGLCDVTRWRPDPDQPPLPDPHPVVAHLLGASANNKRSCEYGGVLRKP